MAPLSYSTAVRDELQLGFFSHATCNCAISAYFNYLLILGGSPFWEVIFNLKLIGDYNVVYTKLLVARIEWWPFLRGCFILKSL